MPKRFIVTHEVVHDNGSKKSYGNAYIVADRFNGSMRTYLELINLARESFPDVADGDMMLARLTYDAPRQGVCGNLPVVHFAVPPDTVVDGWENVEGKQSQIRIH